MLRAPGGLRSCIFLQERYERLRNKYDALPSEFYRRATLLYRCRQRERQLAAQSDRRRDFRRRNERCSRRISRRIRAPGAAIPARGTTGAAKDEYSEYDSEILRQNTETAGVCILRDRSDRLGVRPRPQRPGGRTLRAQGLSKGSRAS